MLRERRLEGVDWTNVAEEVSRLGADDPEILQQRIRILLTSLLRWAYQTDLRSPYLLSTIGAQRGGIKSILQDSAGMATRLEEWIMDSYPEAKRLAVLESGLFDESFPESLPFLPAEVLDDAFLPDPYGDDAVTEKAWRNRL